MWEGDLEGIATKKGTSTSIRLSKTEYDFCMKKGNGNKSNYIRFLIQREMQQNNDDHQNLDEKIEIIVRRILNEMKITPQKVQENESSAEVVISTVVKEKNLKGLKGLL